MSENKKVSPTKKGATSVTQKESNTSIQKKKNTSSKKKTKSPIKTFFKGFLLTILLIGIIGMGFGVFMISGIIKEAPELDVSLIYGTESTVIYDKDGNVISEFGVQKREWVTYDDISPVLIDALLAVEDSNFFKHPGVDFQRLAVAMVTNLLTGDDQGASTLTQQLIKQTHLTSEKTVKRKFQEIYLALEIEKVLTKEQILEAYLNYSPFGGGIYGVEKAAQYYFGTSAKDLTLSQAATLAGLVQRPEAYRPDMYADLAEYRRDIVLQLMVRHGYITQEIADLAAADPITDLLACEQKTVDEIEKYQSFIDVVLKEVEQKYGLDPRSGLQIYTTMDSEAQSLIYDLQHPTLSQEHQIYWPEEMQSGIIFMDTQTGEIRAIGGGYSEEQIERSYNFATQLQRQPGSTAKPIFAYGPAIEYLNWGTGTTVNDELYTYQDGSEKIIHNYNHIYDGRMTIRHALNKSLNVPAVKAFNAVGKDKVSQFVEGLGFNSDEIYESSAIGGVTIGFSPLQMAGAYAAFGNGGVYNEPVTISKIITGDGTVIQAKQDSHRAMSEETAYLMTDMLHTVMTDGTGKTANVSGMYLSGKTGTTNFEQAELEKYDLVSSAIRDSWFVGYSSDYTAAIWTGYKDNTKGQYITSQTQSMPWHVFNRIMKNLNTAGNEKPTRPDSIQSYWIEEESGLKDGEVQYPSDFTPNSYLVEELFIQGYGPTGVSTRFSQLPTPQGFAGQVIDGKLTFAWEHVSTYTLSESVVSEQIEIAKNHAMKANYLKDMPTLNPTESQLRMMLRQLKEVGQTVYEVYGVDYDGNPVLLGSTTNSSLILEGLTIQEISMLESFYLIARYEKVETGNSEPTEPIQIECESCFKPVEIPDMKGWTKEQVVTWSDETGVVIEFKEQSHLTAETGTVLSTTPESGQITPQETLTVILAKKELRVPDYTTQSMAIARYQLWANDHGIQVVTKEEYHPTIAQGELIRVSPIVGSVIQPDSTLTLVISKGTNLNTDSTPSETPDNSQDNSDEIINP